MLSHSRPWCNSRRKSGSRPSCRNVHGPAIGSLPFPRTVVNGRGCVKTRLFEFCRGKYSQNAWMYRNYWKEVRQSGKHRNSILRRVGLFEFSHSLGRSRQCGEREVTQLLHHAHFDTKGGVRTFAATPANDGSADKAALPQKAFKQKFQPYFDAGTYGSTVPVLIAGSC